MQTLLDKKDERNAQEEVCRLFGIRFGFYVFLFTDSPFRFLFQFYALCAFLSGSVFCFDKPVEVCVRSTEDGENWNGRQATGVTYHDLT